MNDFMEKWNSDSRFKTKIKLSLYTLFVVFVAIFAVSNRNNITTNELQNPTTEENNNIDNESNNNTNNKLSINIPDEYNYKINIKINELTYQYTGTKNKTRENITKTVNNINTKYIYENNNYYKENDINNYILTTKDEVYDVIEYNYINLKTINEYLSKSTKIENQYIVYLEDIILGNNSQDYITISLTDNIVNINYTQLLNYFDKSITEYTVKIEIE